MLDINFVFIYLCNSAIYSIFSWGFPQTAVQRKLKSCNAYARAVFLLSVQRATGEAYNHT